MKLRWEIFSEAFNRWRADGVPRMGAALAFYMAFSLAPLLIMVIAVAGFLLGQRNAEHDIVNQISSVIGAEGAKTIDTMISAARKPSSGLMATVIGVLTLIFGATGALVELQDGLNRIWRTRELVGVVPLLRQRLVSLALILSIAFLLLGSLVISAVLSMLGHLLSGRFYEQAIIWQSVNVVLSWVVITGLFALIYKIMPDASVEWEDVWAGAAITSILFAVGKYLVGLYVAETAMTSTYGAAGSFVVILFWVYYSAMILYYGAEFAHLCSERRHARKK